MTMLSTTAPVTGNSALRFPGATTSTSTTGYGTTFAQERNELMEKGATSTKEIQDQILSSIAAGAQTADGVLQDRTYARLQQLVQNRFNGSPNEHSFERLDWRIIQRFFAYLFEQNSAWAHIGEELYGEMQYLHEPPPLKRSHQPAYIKTTSC